MKISKILHVLSVISGVVGIVMIFNSGNMGMSSMMAGNMNGNMMASNPITYLLIAIWLSIGTIHHMKLEEKGEII